MTTATNIPANAKLPLTMRRCSFRAKAESYTKHGTTIGTIVNNQMKRGSGSENGTRLDINRSNGKRTGVRYDFSSYEQVEASLRWPDQIETVKADRCYRPLTLAVGSQSERHKRLLRQTYSLFVNSFVTRNCSKFGLKRDPSLEILTEEDNIPTMGQKCPIFICPILGIKSYIFILCSSIKQ